MGSLNINLDELISESYNSNVQGPRCAIERLLASVEAAHGKQEAKKLSETIDNLEVKPVTLKIFLSKNGYEVSISQLRYHRKRSRGVGCRCE